MTSSARRGRGRADNSGGQPTARRELSTGKKRILLVSDNSELLIELWTRIATERTSFAVQIADTSTVALNAIRADRIDAAVVDLAMAELRGFELLTHLAAKQPNARVVVVGKSQHKRANDLLVAVQADCLLAPGGDLKGICSTLYGGESPLSAHVASPCVMAALVSHEQATCVLTIDGTAGTMAFSRGALTDARTADAEGDAAAVALLRRRGAALTVSGASGIAPRTVLAPVEELIARALDNRESQAPGAPVKLPGIGAPRSNTQGIGRREPGTNRQATSVAPTRAGPAPTVVATSSPRAELMQEKKMALEQHLQQLKDIKGYKASGIMHFTGDMLISDSVDPNINLAMVGATFNDIFRSAHEASKKIGLDACKETVIVTPKGLIVMACSGVDSKAHVHLIGILSADGNSSLMKMQLQKLLPEIVGELA